MADEIISAGNPAMENLSHIDTLVREVKVNTIGLGILLYENRQNLYFQQAGYPTFKDYCESLGLASYSQMVRLANMIQTATEKQIPTETLIEIGITKMTMLHAVKNITPEMIAIARTGTETDLKAMLGRPGREHTEDSIDCPQCGNSIRGAKWVQKKS